MTSLDITSMASLHARWSEARHAVLASNVAHADTVGAKTGNVAPFSEILKAADGPSPATLTATQAGHVRGGDTAEANIATSWKDAAPKLQQSMMDLGANRRAHELNTAISGAFHRFHLAVLRG